MSSLYVLVSDFFLEDIIGGGEINSDELIRIFVSRGLKIVKIRSNQLKISDIDKLEESSNSIKYIISNFLFLKEEVKDRLQKEKYVIYEHDHKYLFHRNPSLYEEYLAPPSDIINMSFYKNSNAVMCQSAFHKNILQKNLKIENVINLSGNLWSEELLNLMADISKKEKKDRCSIMDSPIDHKNTAAAIGYCRYKNYEYDLIPHMATKDFLREVGKNNKLIFFPKTPETLSRITVEARMMGMSVIGNKNIGATREPWFKSKGLELIEVMKKKRKEIPNLVLEALDG
tara:strand:+ start:410 stop:1267 length:858 start_codon:yes stop_codon:yes gene_type:complete